MADTGLIAPIIGGLFFVIAAIIGACLCYFYFKMRKIDSEQGRQPMNSPKPNYTVSNPFVFYLSGVVPPVEFSSSAFTIEMEGERAERNLASKCSVEEQQCKLPAEVQAYRSTSHKKPLRPHCHLQVIQETEEENEEESDKV